MLLFGAHDTERNNAVALADFFAGRLVGVNVRDRKLAQVIIIACRRPDADVIVRADVGTEAERPPDGTHVRSLHQLGALLVAKVSFEPDGAIEGVAAAPPPWWYDTATSTWESGIFRLRACSRIVIAVHAASEALSNS
jgi:hypothetical protein